MNVTLRSSILLLAAAATATTLTAAVSLPKLMGAPLVCFPIEVDANAQLPFVKGGEQPNVAMSALPAAAQDALARSDDPQFHMELLRRTGMAGDSAGASSWSEFIDRLEHAALAAAAEPESTDAAAKARRALRFFDLGYALEVGETLGRKDGDGAPYLRKAAELSPDDPALSFGVALPLFQDWLMYRADVAKRQATARACYVQLSLALASDDARLRRNLLATFGSFLDCKTHEQLVAEVRRQLGGA